MGRGEGYFCDVPPFLEFLLCLMFVFFIFLSFLSFSSSFVVVAPPLYLIIPSFISVSFVLPLYLNVSVANPIFSLCCSTQQ